jgi:hypothetical protein
MVGQVKIVGILMLVHGLTVILMGGLLAAVGSWLMFAMPAPAAGGGGPPPELIAAIYGVWGGVIIVCGLLNSVAGFRLMSFRGRVLGIVALFSNAVVLFSCYCALTGIAMMVYGLIVLFHSDVARAFELVAQGSSPEEVVGRLTPRYDDPRDDYDEMSSPRSDWEKRRRRRTEDTSRDDDDDQP